MSNYQTVEDDNNTIEEGLIENENDEEIGFEPNNQGLGLEEEEKPKNNIFGKKKISIMFILSLVAYFFVGIFLILVLASVIVLIIFAKHETPKQKFTFDHVFDKTLVPKTFGMKWSKPFKKTAEDDDLNKFSYWKVSKSQQQNKNGDLKTYSCNNFIEKKSKKSIKQDQQNSPHIKNSHDINEDEDVCELVEYSVKSQETKVLLSNEKRKQLHLSCGMDYQLSSKGDILVFKTGINSIFRHSSTGKYIYYNVNDQTVGIVSPRQNNKQQILKWCPGNENVLAYVEDNNIYVKQFSPAINDFQATFDGDVENLFNGVADWVYEEEVLEQNDAFFWSEDCKNIIFLKLNDTNVPEYNFPHYDQKKKFPEIRKVKIPTTGDKNPIPSVHVFNLQSQSVNKLDLFFEKPTERTNDFYVYDFGWKNNQEVYVTRQNRIQNEKTVLTSDIVNDLFNHQYRTHIIRNEKSSNAWIQYSRSIFFLPNHQKNDLYIDIIQDEAKDRFSIGLFNATSKNNLVKDLFEDKSFDNVNIIELFKIYNVKNNEIFYRRTNDKGIGSTESQVCSLNINDFKEKILSNYEKSKGYFGANISPNGEKVMIHYLGPQIPKSYLRNVEDESNILFFEENKEVSNKLAEIGMPTFEFKQIENQDKVGLNALFLYPSNFVKSQNYPVLMNLYNGPNINLVFQKHSSIFDPFLVYLASSGFVVIKVDGTGTGFKGVKFLTKTYKNLGDHEVNDQIFAAKAIQKMNFVDQDSLSIFGWSYGGFMTLRVILSDQNKKDKIFKLGLSVAPVTNWNLYDSAYTEKFMSLPILNKDGYEKTSVLSRITDENLKCVEECQIGKGKGKTELLLSHGTADDNVHPINSMKLISRLQKCENQFDLMFYPNENHSILDFRKFLWRKLALKLKEKIFKDYSGEL